METVKTYSLSGCCIAVNKIVRTRKSLQISFKSYIHHLESKCLRHFNLLNESQVPSKQDSLRNVVLLMLELILKHLSQQGRLVPAMWLLINYNRVMQPARLSSGRRRWRIEFVVNQKLRKERRRSLYPSRDRCSHSTAETSRSKTDLITHV